MSAIIGIKNFCKKLFKTIKDNPISLFLIILLVGLTFVLFFVSRKDLISRFIYECREIGNYDTYLYYTVGHALSEGKIPYLEMYENKPPMIFLLSALSYSLTGGYRLVNVLFVIALFVIFLVPVLFVLFKLKKNRYDTVLFCFAILATLCVSALFTAFCEECSGEVQIETFGSACVLLSLLSAQFNELFSNKSRKFYSPSTIINGVFIGLATMFKEPFVVINVACIALFCKSPKDYLYKIIFPGVYAVITCVIILLFGNCFVPYFTIYIKNMFSSHISIYGSPLKRALNLEIIFKYLTNNSFALSALIFVSFFVTTYRFSSETYANNQTFNFVLKFINALKPIVCLFLVSFVVGLGGQYYNHHHVFAVPFWISLCIISCDYFLKIIESEKTAQVETNAKSDALNLKLRFLPVIICIVALSVFTCSDFSKKKGSTYVNSESVINRVEQAKEDAVYIDDLLYALDEDTYLWLGFNGYNPYAFTKHLPSGPCFAQDKHNFTDENSFFVTSFKRQLQNANVIVFYYYNVGILEDETKAYIKDNFTLTPPAEVSRIISNKPQGFRYSIYYRKTFV